MQDVEPTGKPPIGPAAASAVTDEAKPIRPAIAQARRDARPRHPLVDRVLDGVKTFAWVAPLTILIWIYAERKQSAVRGGVTVPVEVTINSKDKIVILKNPPDQNFIATLSGPQAALQRVLDTISAPTSGNHAAVKIVIDARTSGDANLNALENLRRNPVFAQAGIAVRDVIPSTMNVTVLDLEDRMVPVRAPEGLQNLANPRFDPAEIPVRAPRTVFERATMENRLYVTADLAKVDAVRQPGHHELKGVPVTPAFVSEYTTLNPNERSVTASFEVNRADAEATLDYGIPVWPAASVPFLNKYKVECDTLIIPGLHVKGPQDQIDLVKSQAVRVVALLYVLPDDLTGGKKRRILKIDLPPGVQATNDPEQYTVTFSVIERSQAE